MALLNSKRKHKGEAGTNLKDMCAPYKLEPQERRRVQTIIAGSIRAPHRLQHAGLATSDVCDNPKCKGARCDTHHILWKCHKFDQLRAPFIKALDSKMDMAKMQDKTSYLQCKKILGTSYFQQCGICCADPDAINQTYGLEAHDFYRNGIEKGNIYQGDDQAYTEQIDDQLY
jgi:hypothetical protein